MHFWMTQHRYSLTQVCYAIFACYPNDQHDSVSKIVVFAKTGALARYGHSRSLSYLVHERNISGTVDAVEVHLQVVIWAVAWEAQVETFAALGREAWSGRMGQRDRAQVARCD